MPNPLGPIGDLIGGGVKGLAGGLLDDFGKWLWDGGMQLLGVGIKLADKAGTVNLDVGSGPIHAVWPVTLGIAAVLASILFYWQLATVAAKGGHGLLRSVRGTAQFGVALAASVSAFASLVAVADFFTGYLLKVGLNSANFDEAFSHTGISDATANGVKGAALGLMSAFGVIPISLGFAFEMVMRAATIYLLVAVIPITAAGLVSGSTDTWYWKTSHWLMAAIVMKPVMALAIVLGVGIAGGGQGLMALIVGLAVLFVALFAPLALFRLFAFTSGKATEAFQNAWNESGAGDALDNAKDKVTESVSGSQSTASMESSTDARYASSDDTSTSSDTSSDTSSEKTDTPAATPADTTAQDTTAKDNEAAQTQQGDEAGAQENAPDEQTVETPTTEENPPAPDVAPGGGQQGDQQGAEQQPAMATADVNHANEAASTPPDQAAQQGPGGGGQEQQSAPQQPAPAETGSETPTPTPSAPGGGGGASAPSSPGGGGASAPSSPGGGGAGGAGGGAAGGGAAAAAAV